MLLICLLILFLQVGPGWADELSLLGDPEVIVSKTEEEVVDNPPVIPPSMPALPQKPQSLVEMDDYMHQEEGRIKAIKLLSLDLEKANIELKQREVQVKMAELNKSGAFVAPASSPLDQASVSKRLISLTVSGDFKEAVIEVNGAGVIVREGDAVADGKVGIINDEGLTLIYPEGKEEQLRLN